MRYGKHVTYMYTKGEVCTWREHCSFILQKNDCTTYGDDRFWRMFVLYKDVNVFADRILSKAWSPIPSPYQLKQHRQQFLINKQSS